MPSATRGGSGPDERRLTPTRRRLVRQMRTFANDLELYIAAAGRDRHMHRTDLAGLAVVMDQQADGVAVTPGRLSELLQLSAPATSAMIDRLEGAGHLLRTPHPSDRRSTVLELTDHAWSVGGQMFARFAARLDPVLDDHTDAELELVAGFLERSSHAATAAREDPPATSR